MKKLLAIMLVLFAAHMSVAEDVHFNGVKLADAKGKQADAVLTLNDADKKVVVKVADRELATIPYDSLDKVSYEFTKHHRITQGAVVMVASLGAGAIVMLTKSKSHWLYLDYHDQSAPKTVVLRMDKKQYKDILQAVEKHTGKHVQDLSGQGAAKKS